MISDLNPKVHFSMVEAVAVKDCRCIVAVLPQMPSAAIVRGLQRGQELLEGRTIELLKQNRLKIKLTMKVGDQHSSTNT
jgi:hypothetical protein